VGGREWQCHSLRLHKGSSNILSVAFAADSNTIPAKVNNTEREGESSGRRGTTESMPRTDRRSFANGGNQWLAY